jgi:lysophospholipase-2
MAVTLNFGMRMNSWFDLRSLNPNEPEDEEGILSASKKIHEMIADQEKQGIPHDRIILGGFSQGGALALYAGLTYPKKLAGIVALSCWLPLHRQVPALVSEPNKSLPVIQCHGDADFVVPVQWGAISSEILSTFLDKSNYQFKIYSGLSHSSSSAELNDVIAFIRRHLAKK